MRRGDGLVYSTQHGRMCPGCARPLAECSCAAARAERGDGVVTGVPLDDDGLRAPAAELKRRCGSGG